MKDREPPEKTPWVCKKCNVLTEMSTVQIAYLGSVFSIDLPRCPQCGAVVVTEEIADGKMVEAEQLLEDK